MPSTQCPAAEQIGKRNGQEDAQDQDGQGSFSGIAYLVGENALILHNLQYKGTAGQIHRREIGHLPFVITFLLITAWVFDIVLTCGYHARYADVFVTVPYLELCRLTSRGNNPAIVVEKDVLCARILRQRIEDLGYLGEWLLVHVCGFECMTDAVCCDGGSGDMLLDNARRDVPAGHRVLSCPHSSEDQPEGESQAGLEAPRTALREGIVEQAPSTHGGQATHRRVEIRAWLGDEEAKRDCVPSFTIVTRGGNVSPGDGRRRALFPGRGASGGMARGGPGRPWIYPVAPPAERSTGPNHLI